MSIRERHQIFSLRKYEGKDSRVSDKKKIRDSLEKNIQEFIDGGGAITHLPTALDKDHAIKCRIADIGHQ